jgi:hypothetical protein
MNQAEESIGMAMTFTIASSAREALSGVISNRIRKENEAEDKRVREYEEVGQILILKIEITGV